ncbi:nucleotidyl transferase AbiEii/AbiGii toxin family protein [Candidatus Omnitrophota bacterium]
MKKPKVRGYQDKVLKTLSGKVGEFYLAGGTALSLFYFQHRLSVDLDFFTTSFSSRRIKEIMADLGSTLNKKIELVSQNLEAKESRMFIYYIHFSKRDILKIDFIEDALNLIKPTKTVDNIRILSLEDIYLRKLFAVTGAISRIDETGRPKTHGGRVEAKDFYDLYFLSHTFMSMSRFIAKYGNAVMIEGLVRWFRTYDRMHMMDGVLSLEVNRAMDYKKMEGHFKNEIDKIIENQLGDI